MLERRRLRRDLHQRSDAAIENGLATPTIDTALEQGNEDKYLSALIKGAATISDDDKKKLAAALGAVEKSLEEGGLDKALHFLGIGLNGVSWAIVAMLWAVGGAGGAVAPLAGATSALLASNSVDRAEDAEKRRKIRILLDILR